MNSPALAIVALLHASQVDEVPAGEAEVSVETSEDVWVAGSVLSDEASARAAELATSPSPHWATPLERVLQNAASVAPDTFLEVAMHLSPGVPDLTAFVGASAEDRAILASLVRDQNRVSRSVAEAELRALGAEPIGYSWSTHIAHVRIPAALVPAALGLTSVLDASPGAPGAPSATKAHYNGNQRAEAMNRSTFRSDGAIGAQGNRVDDGEIRIGIAEAWEDYPDTFDNRLHRTHPGWLDWSGGPSRIKGVYDCTPGCSTTSVNATYNTHGTAVASVAAASIDQGQDGAYSGSYTVSQEIRSGAAVEAEIFYFRTPTAAAWVQAIDEGLELGLDVMNFSQSWENVLCDPANDYSGINAAFGQALAAGMLIVVSAGNTGDGTSACTMAYPSYRPEAIGVAGLRTIDDTTYSATIRQSSSAVGLVPITVNGWGATTIGPYLAAPHHVSHTLAYPLGYRGGVTGTSYAAPLVTGVAALLRDALDRNNWGGSADVGGRIFAAMGTQGDRWAGPAGGTRSNNAGGFRAGMGRVRGHFNDAVSLPSPRLWSMGDFVLSDNGTQTLTRSLPSGTAQFKVVMTWFDDDMQDASDIVLRVDDTCPSGGGTTLLGSDYSYNLRKRVSFTHTASACLEIKATAYHIPAGETRRVYYTYYYHDAPSLDEF